MTTYQEAQWIAQQARPVYPPFRQTALWDEVQRVGDVARRPMSFYQNIAYAPYAQTLPRRDLAGQLRNLQRHYLIVDSDREVNQVLDEYASLYPLLLEAVRPLKAAFGDRLFHIRVQQSDYDTLLKVAIQLNADFARPETALNAFDSSWWINNCHRSSGALVFDYEIQDGI
jgi:hypothetical protein